MRFIYCADLHLDSPLRGLERYEGAPAQEMREATAVPLSMSSAWPLNGRLILS